MDDLEVLDRVEDPEIGDQDLLDSIEEFSRPSHWLPPVCMIPDCACPGEAHP